LASLSWYDFHTMQTTEAFPSSRSPHHTALWVFIGLMMHGLPAGLPAGAETYHCYDEAGMRVLTDNPAQLYECIQLPSQISSGMNGGPLSSTHHNTPSAVIAHPVPDEVLIPDRGDIQDVDTPAGLPDEDITVSLTKIGGSLVVRAMLNQERSAQLIVDTGASMTVLSTQAAIDLGILGTTDNELLIVHTAGGPVQVNMNYLPSLTVGTAQVTKVPVVIHDLPDIPEQIEGLLGMSFLKHFLVTLDAEHGRLILRPKQQQ
jgi:clan AA aspartic protease (TIGR02281 family)